jgi:acetyltransferase-like isoleucine patch superfamily enzyme
MSLFKNINTKILTFISKVKININPHLLTKNNSLYKKYEIGEFTYGSPKVMTYGTNGKLKIGKFCSIAEGVKIFLGGEHKTKNISTYPFKEMLKIGTVSTEFSRGDVTIGNDVWIGYGAIILSGVTIGNGSVIGAGSVINKSVDPYSIVVGNRGEVIKKRFNEKTIKTLNESQWWDWDIKKIAKNINLFTENPEKNLSKIKKLCL